MNHWVRIEERHERVVIVACGPSLACFDFAKLNGFPCVVAVNRAWKGLRDASHWLTVDTLWVHAICPPLGYPARKLLAAPDDIGCADAGYACDRAAPPEGVELLRRAAEYGLSEDPSKVHTINSGFGALNLAYHFRARKVAMLGVDGNRLREYFFGPRKTTRKDHEVFHQLGPLFRSAVPQLDAAGCSVVNGSPDSAITCFPRVSPEEAIEWLSR